MSASSLIVHFLLTRFIRGDTSDTGESESFHPGYEEAREVWKVNGAYKVTRLLYSLALLLLSLSISPSVYGDQGYWNLSQRGWSETVIVNLPFVRFEHSIPVIIDNHPDALHVAVFLDFDFIFFCCRPTMEQDPHLPLQFHFVRDLRCLLVPEHLPAGHTWRGTERCFGGMDIMAQNCATGNSWSRDSVVRPSGVCARRCEGVSWRLFWYILGFSYNFRRIPRTPV